MIYRLGVIYLFGLLLLTLCFSAFYPELSLSTDVQNSLQMPSSQHFFGTDSLGRDLFFRVVHGARTTLSLGLLCTLIAVFIGTLYGGIAGFAGGLTEQVMMRFVEILMSLPQMVTIGFLVLFFSRLSLGQMELAKLLFLAVAIALGSWMMFARLVQSLVSREKSLPYVEAARAVGASPQRILRKHIFPNLIYSLLVMMGLQLPNYLLFEGFLSFIGIGVQPPTPSWGILIQEGWKTLSTFPHLLLFPSGVLFLTVFSINYVFDFLRRKLSRPIGGIDTHH